MAKIIGIDLGTTNSCVAVMEGGQPVIIPNAEGMRTTPSVVAFTKTGERLVGDAAKRQAITNPDNTVASIKREMGTNHKRRLNGKDYSPQEISAMILQKLKVDAENYLGEQVTDAVITVPAYFDDNKRQATVDAGKIAGLNVQRIINEPTSAALAYGLDNEKEQKIMVYDLGGGTFDVSIIDIGDGVVEVLATNGVKDLGGDDFDLRVMNHMIEEFKRQEDMDLSKDKMAVQRLKEAAEKAKKELSSMATTEINLPFITMNQDGPKHFTMTLSRAKFDELTADLVEKTVEPVKSAMRDSKISFSDLDKVLLVGGSTRIPAVQELVKKLTGKEPFKGINPDECVAVGAGIQGGKLSGEEGVGDLVLVDVTPLTLGIETLGGVMTRMIERNTTIPTKKTETFSTAADNQNAVDIVVVQGERQFARDNVQLGTFRLDGIAPAPRGIPQIEVTFDIDRNGIVQVSAKDKGTGKEQKITITSRTKLSDDEIDKAVNEAKQYEEQDKRRKEIVDVKNEADTIIFQCEKMLKDNADKIGDDDKSKIEEEIGRLKSVNSGMQIESMSESDVAILRQGIESLTKVLHEVSTKMYQNAPQDGGSAPGEENTYNAGDDNVVDGDYKEM